MARNDVVQKKLIKLYLNSGVDAGSLASLNDQAVNLYGGYRDSLSLLKLDRGRLKTAFRAQRGDIRTQRREDLQSAAGAAVDRGVLGSSADVSARSSIVANAASQIVQARDARTQGIQSNLAQAMQARRDFFAGMAGLQAQRAAMKGAAANKNFLERIIEARMRNNNNNNGNNPNQGGEGNPQTFGPNDLTRAQITNRLGNVNPDIRRLLEQVQNPTSATAYEHQMDELESVWARRNRLRKLLGRKALNLGNKLGSGNAQPGGSSSQPAVGGGKPIP